MKVCEVKGTNQGLVTAYKTFTSQYIHLYYIIVSREEQERRFVSAINFCKAVKIDVFVFIESELSPNRSTS